jgi:multidrug efflux system membrane fusion protein
MRLTGLLALLVAASAASGCREKAAPPAGPRAVSVSAARVERRDLPVSLEGLGTVIAYRSILVRPLVDGVLEQVFFLEGQLVRAGDPLAQIDPRPFLNQLHQAEGALQRDLAVLAASRRDLKRYQALAAQSLIAQQQADDQRSAVGQAEGAVRVDRAAIDSAKLNLDYARVNAPIDGVVGIRAVDPGNVVRATDAAGIVQLTQIDPISVIFTLPQDAFPQVSEALKRGIADVHVFTRAGGRELGRGRLMVIDNLINTATATLRLKAMVPNTARQLWPNQFVKVRLLIEVLRQALVAPSAALQRGPEGTLVYVVRSDGTVEPRAVRVDLQQGPDAVIGLGLSVGEEVVTEGQNQLRAGSKVAVRGAVPTPAPSPAPAGPGERGVGGAGRGGGGP